MFQMKLPNLMPCAIFSWKKQYLGTTEIFTSNKRTDTNNSGYALVQASHHINKTHYDEDPSECRKRGAWYWYPFPVNSNKL